MMNVTFGHTKLVGEPWSRAPIQSPRSMARRSTYILPMILFISCNF